MADIGFDGKVAIITGAGGGLGRSHALELARRGARIVVNDLGGSVSGDGGDVGPAQAVVQEIHDLGGEAVADTNSIATPEGGAAVGADRGRRVRHRRHRRQQRRHPPRQVVPQPRPGDDRGRHPGAPARRVLRDPARLPHHAGEELRPHREHLVELGPARQLRPDQLRRRQDGPRRAHQGARHRGPQEQHQGQRHRPDGHDPHDRGDVRRGRRRPRPEPGQPAGGLPRLRGLRAVRRGLLRRRRRDRQVLRRPHPRLLQPRHHRRGHRRPPRRHPRRGGLHRPVQLGPGDQEGRRHRARQDRALRLPRPAAGRDDERAPGRCDPGPFRVRRGGAATPRRWPAARSASRPRRAGKIAAATPARNATTTTTTSSTIGDREGVEALVGQGPDERPAEEEADDQAEHGAQQRHDHRLPSDRGAHLACGSCPPPAAARSRGCARRSTAPACWRCRSGR